MLRFCALLLSGIFVCVANVSAETSDPKFVKIESRAGEKLYKKLTADGCKSHLVIRPERPTTSKRYRKYGNLRYSYKEGQPIRFTPSKKYRFCGAYAQTAATQELYEFAFKRGEYTPVQQDDPRRGTGQVNVFVRSKR